MSRKITGTVVSNKMDKTATVAATRLRWSPLYRKQYKITKKFMAHDEDNATQIGDTVEIEEAGKMSRHKRWRIANIVEKGPKV